MGKKITNVHIVYFSGTGGSAYTAEKLMDVFLKKGVLCKISEIFREDYPVLLSEEFLVLIYPVHAADAPLPVYKWIKSIKKILNNKAAVISVSGGGEVFPNKGCRYRIIKRLSKKGLIVTNDYMICMPSNFIKPMEDSLSVQLIRILPEKCDIITDEIISAKINLKSPSLLDRIATAMFQMEKLGVRFVGRKLKISDECNSCALCEKKCPSGNIYLKNGKPYFKWKCYMCMRCIYACPQNAIKTGLFSMFVFKSGFNLKRIIKMYEEGYRVDTEKNKNNILWDGVIKYLKNNDI